MKRLLVTAMLAVILSAASFAATLNDPCQGSNAPPPCTETITSLGQFIIHVTLAPVQAALSGNGHYNSATQDFLSPLLFDPSTQIVRSSSFADGSAFDAAGQPSVFPSGFPTGNNEIHTSINSLNLTGGGFSVTAGNTSDRPASLGEVEALGGSDFPARSFFDVFVDITIPGLGTAINGTTPSDTSNPLIVQANPINSLPPTVIYVHGTSSTVNLYMENGPFAGDLLGTMVLTGHGAGYSQNGSAPGAIGGGGDNAAAFESGFRSIMDSQDPQDATFFDPLISVPEPSTWILLTAGCGLLGAFRPRRKR